MYWQGETYTFFSPFRQNVLASGGNPKLPHFTHQPAIEPPTGIEHTEDTSIYNSTTNVYQPSSHSITLDLGLFSACTYTVADDFGSKEARRA